MKKSVRSLLTILLVLVSLFSAARFLGQQRDNAIGNNTYTDALALATSEKKANSTEISKETLSPAAEPQWVPAEPDEEDPHIRTLEEIDLAALREVNPDVVGWILIPDTVINYPLMQGADNNYYLKRTWDEKKNAVGSIFLEYLNNK
jgi:sortase B